MILVTVMLVTFLPRRLWKNIVDIGDRNGQNRHQHLKVVTNTFRLRQPSVTMLL